MRAKLYFAGWFSALSAGVAITNAQGSSQTPPIRTRLHASFGAPPLLLEIAEGISAYNQSAYFPYILKLAENPDVFEQTDANAYSQVMEWIEQDSLVDSESLALLKLELAVHAYAPAVVAQYEYYTSTIVPDLASVRGKNEFDESCSVWATYKDKQACTPSSLAKIVEVERFYGDTYIEEAKIVPQLLKSDHIYPSHVTPLNKPDSMIILYADPRAEGFTEMHEQVRDLANDMHFTYIIRYRPWVSDNDKDQVLGISGYGVELALKSTEYKAIDDRDLDYNGDSQSDEGSKFAVQSLKTNNEISLFEDEGSPVVKGLPTSQVSALGLQATQLILNSDDKLGTLQQLSQNLPRYAHLLSKTKLNSTHSDKLQELRQLGLREMFMVNGLRLMPEEVDPFQLLAHIRKENSIISSLENIGLSQKEAVSLISSDKLSDDESEVNEPTFDMRTGPKEDGSVVWLNDLEKDNRYATWPKGLTGLRRIFMPGQIQRVRRNTVQIIFAVDMSKLPSIDLIVEELDANIKRGIPMQFGISPMVDYKNPQGNAPSNQMAKLYHYISKSLTKKELVSFLRGVIVAYEKDSQKGLQPIDTTKKLYGIYIKSHKTKHDDKMLTWDQIMQLSSEGLTELWDNVVQYATRLDLSPESSPSGLVFVNGAPISLADNYQTKLFNTFQMQLWELAQALRRGQLDEGDNIQDFIYTQPHVRDSRNTLIYPSDNSPLRFLQLGDKRIQKWVDNDITYLYYKADEDSEPVIRTASVWVVGDFAHANIRKLAASALAMAKNDTSVRIGLVHVGPASQESAEDASEGVDGYDVDSPQIVMQLLAAFKSGKYSDQIVEFTQQYLSGEKSVDEILRQDQFSSVDDLVNELAELTTINSDFMDSFDAASSANYDSMTKLGAVPSSQDSGYVIVNGRILPLLTQPATFTTKTFSALLEFESTERIVHAYDALSDLFPDLDPSDMSRLIVKASAIISYGQTLVGAGGAFQRSWSDSRISPYIIVNHKNATLIKINNPDEARFRIQVILNPLSEKAQMWSVALQTLAKIPSISIELWLNPDVGMKELPIKRFYRYLWPHTLDFDASGRTASPEVVFNGVPTDPLLTLGMDVPPSWLVTAVESVHDLDNIRLSSLKDTSAGIDSTYKLVNILVEGHCVNTNTRSPPRGLEVQLGTSQNSAMTDTIVMANLGYLQLKANPGVWKFSIRSGRSDDLYKLDHIGEGQWNYNAAKGNDGTKLPEPVLVTSFAGTTIFPLVSKRPGMESENLLLEEESESSNSDSKAGKDNESSGLWGKLKSAVGKGVSKSEVARPHFDVFAVASGHLYERLMSIMILSVLNNTESHVKFWLIENFLSPSFKAFVPHMAEEYDFDYEFVTYKWPHWLNHETEKQRTIWGYKILFLDVLFPLNLDRVIFVDADQIIRADLQELSDMDLDGAPYGYVPFCDDRKEIEGYRFWKQGWWKDHLRGKPYHISALYVVDLKRFRLLAAGDRLRGQYQALSRDSNSLANLDQDLPNNMQHIVPIHSLPQEWLWCETWCSDSSLKKAKTIDLCNNPMTKEPKLERARRLLPEWEMYDNQIANFTNELAKRGKHDGVQIADAVAIAIDQPHSKEVHNEDVSKENKSTGMKDGKMHDEL